MESTSESATYYIAAARKDGDRIIFNNLFADEESAQYFITHVKCDKEGGQMDEGSGHVITVTL